MKLTLERQIPLGFVVALLLLVTISFYAYRNTKSLSEAISWEKHTQEVLLKLDETLTLTLDAETGTRGFLITGEESFLESFDKVEQRISANLTELKQLVADNPSQLGRVAKLEILLERKRDLLKRYVAARRTQSLDAVISQNKIGQGKTTMDDARALITDMKEEEQQLLAEREGDLDTSADRTYRILVSGSLAGIISLLLANVAIFREYRKRRQAESALKQSNEELENRVETRTHALAKTNEDLKSEIGKREKSEEVLRESEFFTRAILDSLSAHIAVIDKNGVIVAVNEAWENFAQETSPQSEAGEKDIGQKYLDVCGIPCNDGASFVNENLKAVLNGEKSGFYYEYPFHFTNEERWFILQVNALQSPNGGAVISHINITDRKKAEVLLKNSEEFNRSIFENSPDCVKILELDGSLHAMNNNGLCIMEIDDSDPFVGKTWTDFWEGEENIAALKAIEQARNGETAHFSGYCKTAKGTLKYWDVSIAPVFDATGKTRRLISTSRDITERNQAEREREELLQSEKETRREAEIANRLRDEFLATVSHELRAPLNSILGWGRMMQQGKLDEKTTVKAVETIVRNAESQNRLIEDLLDVSRIISGKMRLEILTLNPTNVVEAALETVRPAAEAKNIRLEIKEDPELSHISGDPNRLQQVIWNLLSNAIKFTPNDGIVSVEIERGATHAEITVKDTGVGIKQEFLPHVFDRFRQADASSIRKFGGLGLGLAIVRHLTEMHGGSVTVSSDGENKGSTFTILLPLVLSENNENGAHSGSPESLLKGDSKLSLDGLLILVIDDEEDTRQLLVQSLTFYGATVTTADSAAAGLREFNTKNPDLVISDVGMPEEDGYSLIRKIRQADQTTPAVALTAFTRAQDRVRALASGFQTHVAKPVEPDELVTVIASLTGRLKAAEAERETV